MTARTVRDFLAAFAMVTAATAALLLALEHGQLGTEPLLALTLITALVPAGFTTRAVRRRKTGAH